MLPNNELNLEINDDIQTSKSYKLNLNNNTVNGVVNKIDAMKQSIYLILQTERYDHIIYSWDYGVEINTLLGKSLDFVKSEVQRHITEALVQDDRIKSVTEFEFTKSGKKLTVQFLVSTIFGEVEIESEVSI